MGDDVNVSKDTPDAASKSTGTLFERIGGRERLMLLLRRFYADVRQQGLIGPIFNQTIHDWPAHLEKIADFWSNVTGGPIRYAGPMPFKHVPLGLAPEHFDAWLDLWRRHCRARQDFARVRRARRPVHRRAMRGLLSRRARRSGPDVLLKISQPPAGAPPLPPT